MRPSTKAIGIFTAVAVLAVSSFIAERQNLLASVSLAEPTGPESSASEVPQTVAVSKGPVRQTVIAPGQTRYEQTTLLGTTVGGKVAAVLVRPGDTVHQGDVLVQLDTAPLETALTAARLERQRAEEEYEQGLFVAGQSLRMASIRLQEAVAEQESRLSEAELAVTIAQSRLDQARLQYPAITAAKVRLDNAIESEEAAAREYQEAVERRDAYWESPEIAEGYLRALETAQDTRAIAEADYNAILSSQAAHAAIIEALQAEVQLAQIALQRLQQGVDPLLEMDVQNAQVALDNLITTGIDPLTQLAVEQAALNLEAAAVVAPYDGMVVEVHVKAGESVSPGAGLLFMADPSAMEVISTVIEEDFPLVQVGQKAELYLDAIPETIFDGQVTHVYPQRIPVEDRPLYHVSIKLDETPPGLASGMTVDATIVIRERQDVLRLPRALVRAGVSESTQLEVWNGAVAQERDVLLGLRGDVYIEISSGLREGERVIGQ